MSSYRGCHMRAVYWLYWNSNARSLSNVILCYTDVIMSSHEFLGAFFKHENAVFNGEQEKIHYSCEEGIEKSVPCDHRLSSVDKSRDAK